MSPEQKRAKELYIKGYQAKEIADELELHLSTVYRWINDKELGFKREKNLANFSVEGISELLIEAYKETILDISENPKKLQNAGVADSILKVVKAIKSLEKDVDYLGVSADIVKKTTELVKEEYPDFLEKWKEIVPRLLEKLEGDYS